MFYPKTLAVKILVFILAFMLFSVSVVAAEMNAEYPADAFAIEPGLSIDYSFPKQSVIGGSNPVEMSIIRYLDTETYNNGDYMLKINIESDFTFDGNTELYQLMAGWSLIINGVEYYPWSNINNNAIFVLYLSGVTFRYIGVKCKLYMYPNEMATVTNFLRVKVTANIITYGLEEREGFSSRVIDEAGNELLQQQNNLQQQGNQLQQESNNLQQQGNQLQQEANNLQEQANETNRGILSRITDFFNGFFSNLGNTVLSWIVPSSEDLTAFLNEVNEWFGERLGFVWYPFDLAVQLVSALAGGSADSTVTIPALSLNMLGGTYTIWNSIEVDIDAFGIFQYVRYFTDVILVAGVSKLAYDKWDEWIGGHGVG